MSAPQDDGVPLITHLQAVMEKTDSVPRLIAEAPMVPEGLDWLWQAFLELHDSRGSTGWGAARITFADIDCWQRVTGSRLSAWEVELVRKADNIWLSEFAPKPKTNP